MTSSGTNQVKNKYYVCFDSQPKLFDLKLRETWKYRELIWLFTRKSLVRRYKQTILGPLWLILTPLLTSIMYTIIFGTVAGIDTAGMPKILFYLVGNGLWAFFADVFTRCSETFSSNARIFGKVYFPRLTVPFSNILLSAVEFLVQFVMVICLCLWYSAHGMSIPYMSWIIIPLILVWIGILAMGLGIIVSSLTTKYRDLRLLVNFGIRLWMYGTPVVYPLSTIAEGTLKKCIMLNPVTAPIELFRKAVLGVGGIPTVYIVISLVFTLVSLLGGIVIFNRIERNFMDTI